MHLVSSLDLRVFQFLNGFAGNWFLDRIASYEEADNLLKGGLFLAMYVYLWFRIGPDQEKRRRAIIAILAATFLTLVLCRTIADLVPFRVRPMFDRTVTHHPYAFPITPNQEDWNSFPSDSAGYFFALAFGLAQLWRRYSLLIMMYVAVWVCLPRAFFGAHYLSDLVVGAAIGIGMVWASLGSGWLRSGLATHVLRFIDARPGIFYACAFLVCFEMAAVFADIRSIGRGLLRASLVHPHHRELFYALLIASAALIGSVTIVIYVVLRLRHRHQLPGAWRRTA